MKTLTNVEQKAIRYVRDGRVEFGEITWQQVTPHELARVVTGTVRGDSGTYQVRVDPEGKHCDCPHGQHRSPNAGCAHPIALELWVEYHWENRQIPDGYTDDDIDQVGDEETRRQAEHDILEQIR